MNRPVLLIGLATTLLAGGCSGIATNPEAELTVHLSAEKTVAAPEDVIGFTVQATGTRLFGVLIAYGDAAVDSVSTPGAKTVTAKFEHAYTSAGSYTVRATANEQSGRRVADSLTVRVGTAP